MEIGDYHPLYIEGIEHFNRQEYYESHDIWEELWTDYRGPSRRFYQGLIQSAVALFHFSNGNTHGARKLYHSSRAYLNDYRPKHLGLDLETFFADFERCFAALVNSQDTTQPVQLDPALLPVLHVDGIP